MATENSSAWVKFRDKVTGKLLNVAPKLAHSAIKKELVRGGADEYTAYNTASNIVGARINNGVPYYPPQNSQGGYGQQSYSSQYPQQSIDKNALLIGGGIALAALLIFASKK